MLGHGHMRPTGAAGHGNPLWSSQPAVSVLMFMPEKVWLSKSCSEMKGLVGASRQVRCHLHELWSVWWRRTEPWTFCGCSSGGGADQLQSGGWWFCPCLLQSDWLISFGKINSDKLSPMKWWMPESCTWCSTHRTLFYSNQNLWRYKRQNYIWW